MSNFTHYNGDPLYSAAAAILEGKQIETPSNLDEGVEEIKKKVEGLKVGDKTNFGVVQAISGDSITFKAKDLPKTKISFNQRKTGSKDFVLDRLMKLKEGVEIEEDIIIEANDPDYSAATNALHKQMKSAQKKKNALFDVLLSKAASKTKATPAEKKAYQTALDDWHNLQAKLQKSMEADDRNKKAKIKKEDVQLEESSETASGIAITEAVSLASDTLKGQIVSLMQLNTSVKVAHWNASTSLNTHKALGDLYEAIEEGIDSFAETEMGISKNRRFMNMMYETRADYSVPSLITELRERSEALVTTSKALGCEDLVNVAAEILGAVNKAAYLLEV